MNSNIRIYTCKDGRQRVYIKDTKKVISYPKYLMEQKLGRPLEPNEQVHHIDENPLNNAMNNLELTTNTEHMHKHRKYKEYKKVLCKWCGKEFYLSLMQQRNRTVNNNRGKSGPFCSKQCSGKFGRNEQLIRNNYLNVRKFGETLPMVIPSQASIEEGVETLHGLPQLSEKISG